METINSRLIDEARHEPVKNAFRLGLEFMDRNRLLAAMTMGLFVLLTLLEMVPLLGLLATIAVGVFSQAVQIYVGRTFYQSADIQAFVADAESASLRSFLTRYQVPGFGGWLGWFAVSMIFATLFVILYITAGGNASMLDPDALQNQEELFKFLGALGTAGFPLLLTGLLLTYVYPIAQGRVIMSDTFSDAFKAVFSVFTPTVWAAAMKKEYFSFVFFFSLALIGISVLVGVTMMLLFLIPFLGPILAVVWMMFLIYAFIMILGVANALAREIAET
jgi:hypothetical protein